MGSAEPTLATSAVTWDTVFPFQRSMDTALHAVRTCEQSRRLISTACAAVGAHCRCHFGGARRCCRTSGEASWQTAICPSSSPQIGTETARSSRPRRSRASTQAPGLNAAQCGTGAPAGEGAEGHRTRREDKDGLGTTRREARKPRSRKPRGTGGRPSKHHTRKHTQTRMPRPTSHRASGRNPKTAHPHAAHPAARDKQRRQGGKPPQPTPGAASPGATRPRPRARKRQGSHAGNEDLTANTAPPSSNPAARLRDGPPW